MTNAGVGEILVLAKTSEGIGIEGNGFTILNTNRIVADGFQAVGIGVLGDSGTISNLGGTIETTVTVHRLLVSLEPVPGRAGHHQRRGY